MTNMTFRAGADKKPAAGRLGWLGWLPALLALMFTILVQATYSTPLGSLLWYLAVFAFVVTGPGTLTYRAILGTHGSWAVDLAFGTAVGLLLQLVFWAAFVGLGVGYLLALGAVLVYAVFLGFPPFRRHWRIRPTDRDPMPLSIRWLLAATYGLALIVYSGSFSMAQPPAANAWYQDEYWHLGNAAWLLNHVVTQDVRVAGQPLTYHWFSSAHAAAQSLASQLDLNLVVGRLWAVPFYGAVIVLVASVTRKVAGNWWPGVLASLMMISTATLRVTSLGFPDGGAMTVHSPSQTYATAIFLLVISLLAKLWQEGRLPPLGWVLLGLSLLSAQGAKSSLLPLIICGLALTVLVSLATRSNRLISAVALAMAAGALAVTFTSLGGGGESVRLQIFSTIRQIPFYVDQLHLTSAERQFGYGFIPPGLATPLGLVTVAVILLLYLARYFWVIAVLPALRSGSSQAWFLLGLGLAGFSAAMLINHDGMSQLYFFRDGLVPLYMLASWGLWTLWDQTHAGLRMRVLLGGAIAGITYFTLWYAVADTGPLLEGHDTVAALISAAAAIGPATLLWLAGTRRPTHASPLRLAVVSGLIAASIVPGLTGLRLSTIPEGNEWSVTQNESEAALWLRDHSAPDDIAATNVHCLKEQVDRCDTRSFWVSGLTQRRILIEGWAYTPSMRGGQGENGLWYGAQPFRDQELFALNEAAFSAPTADVIHALAEHGVRWLYADSHRKEVSSNLREFAETVYSNDDVTIYRVDA